jgi:Tfp pilus assembly protein PilV
MGWPRLPMTARASSESPLHPGFSLVEVVIAIGICALAVTSVLALLGPVTTTIAAARDAHAAARVVCAVQAGLQDMPSSTVSSYLANGDLLYASRGGDRVGTYFSSVWNDLGPSQQSRDREKFFEITLIQNSTLSPAPGALVFTMRLRWPAFAADGQQVTDDAPRNVLFAPTAISR